MIRLIGPEETAILTEGGRHFFKEGSLPGEFKEDVFSSSWSGMIASGFGYVLAAFNDAREFMGALGFILSPDPNNGDLVATEAFWYVLPGHRGHGIRLLKAYEEHARQAGAKRIGMVHLLAINQGLGKLYERLGYKPVEVNYLKNL